MNETSKGGPLFKNREDAGRLLAEELSFLKSKRGELIVLAIPRGGAVVAKEVATALGAPLDVVVTRKIGAPGYPELAVGAVTDDGEVIVESDLLAKLGVSDAYVRGEGSRQMDEIRRRTVEYRGDRLYPSLVGMTVVIVDDGVATGATIRAAIQSVKRRKAAFVILAVPVGPGDTISDLSRLADQVVCLSTPEPFFAIGEFYQEFEPVEDGQVREILKDYRPGF